MTLLVSKRLPKQTRYEGPSRVKEVVDTILDTVLEPRSCTFSAEVPHGRDGN